MLKDEVGMDVGYPMWMMVMVEEIGEVRKLCVDRVMAEMIIGVTTRMAIKEISGSTARIDFRRMIEYLTIGDTNLEMGGQKDDFSRGDQRNRELWDTGAEKSFISEDTYRKYFFISK
ncbi:UNVERIFIED_CONTAM: hypothetical protein NCL1_43829 [Trichonephila clavipes]